MHAFLLVDSLNKCAIVFLHFTLMCLLDDIFLMLTTGTVAVVFGTFFLSSGLDWLLLLNDQDNRNCRFEAFFASISFGLYGVLVIKTLYGNTTYKLLF